MPNYAVQRRRGTTAEHSSFAGLAGELTVDTTKDTVVVHDGSTNGGIPLLRQDVNNLAADAISGDKVHGGTISGSVALADGATAATQSAGNNTTLVATTAFVTTAVAGEDTLAEMGDVALVAAASGDMLVHDGLNWVDVAMSGDATMASNGAVTIAANSVALGTDTTGNYVLSIADAGSSNITVVNGSAEGGAVTLDTAQDIGTGDSPTFVGLTLTGDLTVQGTTTTVDSTTVSIADAMIQLASGNSGASAAYIGMQAERGATDAYFVWEESSDRWRATTSADGTTHSDADMQAAIVYAQATSAQYADLAERYHADETIDPGTIVELGGVNEITSTKGFCSTAVFGVIATQPAFKMNSEAGTSTTHPYVTLTGRTPVKVVGKVNKGDRLISSEIPGIAQALPQDFIAHCNDNSDQMTLLWGVIGRALEDKDTDDVDTIEAYIQVNS